jgi:amidase
MGCLDNPSAGVKETKKDLEQVAQDKRAEGEARSPQKWLITPPDLPSDDTLDVTGLCAGRGWLSKQELIITNSSMVQIASDVKEGRYTAEEVIEAFAHRATIAHQLVNPYVLSLLEPLTRQVH